MERLDACYFCGTAADAPLSEVTISPRSRQDDPDATVRVTLCPSCETKLERVLRGLFDHVESREPDEDSADERSSDEPTAAAEANAVDRIDISTTDDPPAAPEEGRRLFTDEPDEAEAGEQPTAEPADNPSTTEEDAEILDPEPRARARATASSEANLDDVSVSEYNRVMRLLQNRTFPIGRVAFVDLAANAYDLAEDTVEAVLNELIDQGSLVEREGQLDRPDQEGP